MANPKFDTSSSFSMDSLLGITEAMAREPQLGRLISSLRKENQKLVTELANKKITKCVKNSSTQTEPTFSVPYERKITDEN